jgi:hypothetical protein
MAKPFERFLVLDLRLLWWNFSRVCIFLLWSLRPFILVSYYVFVCWMSSKNAIIFVVSVIFLFTSSISVHLSVSYFRCPGHFHDVWSIYNDETLSSNSNFSKISLVWPDFSFCDFPLYVCMPKIMNFFSYIFSFLLFFLLNFLLLCVDDFTLTTLCVWLQKSTPSRE